MAKVVPSKEDRIYFIQVMRPMAEDHPTRWIGPLSIAEANEIARRLRQQHRSHSFMVVRMMSLQEWERAESLHMGSPENVEDNPEV